MDVDRRRIADLERQVETLRVAIEHRTQIGMALGIIMERLAVDQGPAFEYLVRCSQAQNQKVYDLAVRLVEARALPDSQGRQGA
jgi:AmiR/NasT family two-component response regulator